MITLIIKTTDGCNLRCKYCSIGNKQQKYTLINKDMLFKIADYIVVYANYRMDNHIKIILHGGEPTLVDSDTYRDFFRYALESYKEYTWSFSIQTNGYQISTDYIELFKEYNVNVGISIDGNSIVHDSIRVNTAGKGSFSAVKNNIIKLVANKIDVSALMVVSKRLIGEDLDYLNFYNYYNIPLKINPLLQMGEAENESELWLSPGDYADYLIRIFKYMLFYEIEIDIKPISEIFNAVVNNLPMRDCSYKQVCGKNIICIDNNGDIFPCGRYYDIEGACLGNIADKQIEFNIPLNKIDIQCENCKYRKWCYGGCSAYRTILNTLRTPLCEDIKQLFDYFTNEGISEYIEYLKEKKSMLEQLLCVEDINDEI